MNDMTAMPQPATDAVFDAGTEAREKLVQKKTLRDRWIAFKRFVWLCLVLTLIGCAAVVWYRVQHMPKVYSVDSRPCEFNNAEKGIKITGHRYYSYYQYSLFGIDFRFGDSVAEKTVIDVPSGPAMTVIGVDMNKEDPRWWSVHLPQAQPGVQKLNPADLYTFVVGNKSVAVDANTFCR